MSIRGPASSDSIERRLFGSLALVLTVLWTAWAGNDASWDVFNHHLYLPFSLVSGRYAVDLFAAGPQSYQNPLGYLPFYGLVRANLPSWAVGSSLALMHGLAAWPLHGLATSIWGHGAEARPLRLLALVAAFAAPSFLLVAGTTSVDPLCGVLVLIALATAVDNTGNRNHAIFGGAAMGLAVAIKPTNLVFAVAVASVLIVRRASRQISNRNLIGFGVAMCVVALAGAGPWSAWLWSTFQSPLFPLFNQVFHSPYAPSGPTVAGRFLPESAWEYLTRPWVIAEFRSFTSTEAFAPDLRPLLALVALACACTLSLYRRTIGGWFAGPWWERSDLQLGLFALVAYVLWMATSGNSRYAIALFMVVGLLMARAWDCLLPRHATTATLALLVGLQVLYYVGDGDKRYHRSDWTEQPFFDVKPSPRLQREPFLHLSTGMQSFSAVAAFLHPGGALVNVIGQFSLPLQGPLGEALTKRLEEWEGRVRFLFLVPPTMDNPEKAAAVRTKLDYLTYKLRLRVDWSDCEKITIDGASIGEARPVHLGPSKRAKDDTALWSCRAVRRIDIDPRLEARLARADRVFVLIEKQCPRIFGPVPMVSDIGETVIQRRYANYDVRVSASETEGVSLSHFRSSKVISMGSIDQVIDNGGMDACKAWKKLSAP